MQRAAIEQRADDDAGVVIGGRCRGDDGCKNDETTVGVGACSRCNNVANIVACAGAMVVPCIPGDGGRACARDGIDGWGAARWSLVVVQSAARGTCWRRQKWTGTAMDRGGTNSSLVGRGGPHGDVVGWRLARSLAVTCLVSRYYSGTRKKPTCARWSSAPGSMV